MSIISFCPKTRTNQSNFMGSEFDGKFSPQNREIIAVERKFMKFIIRKGNGYGKGG